MTTTTSPAADPTRSRWLARFPLSKDRLRRVLWPQRYQPWQGRASRVDKILMGAFLAMLVFGLAIKPLKPFLLATDPVLLEFLTGDLIVIGAGAAFARIGDASLWLVVIAGAIGMMKLHWLTWWAGRQWGAGILKMLTTSERAERFAGRAAQWNPWIIRSAVLFAFLPGIPGPIVFAMAGMAGMRLGTFLVLDLIGAVLMTALVAGLGYHLGQQAVDVVLLIDSYALVVSLTMIAATVLIPVLKRRLRAPSNRQRRSP